jgi:CDP-diacylglycerol--glycerol-3-phosphate 3-phosphatidyltransferase
MLRHLPNILSSYRLIAFPYLIYLVATGEESLFSVLIVVNLVTDILDGWIARRFNLQTEFGAQLDSLADYGTYIAAFYGLYVFKQAELGDWINLAWAFAAFIAAFLALSFAKFRRSPSLHLYSTKIGGYLQGFLFFTLFTWGFWAPYFAFALLWGIASFVEGMVILLLLPEMRANQRGLYWVLRSLQ